MRNLLLFLLVANILYFIWGMATETPKERGVVIVSESQLGPPLEMARKADSSAEARRRLEVPVEITGSGDQAPGVMPGATRLSTLAASVGRSCVSIGPFTSNPDATQVLIEYRDEGMRARVRSDEGQLFVGHWVQIRDVPDREAGNEMLDRLIAGGLTDAYLVPTDDEGLKISLGLFGQMDRAERVELQAQSLDFAAEITPRMRDATVYYVDIALPPGRGARAMIEKHGEDKVLLRERATCPGSQ